MSIKGKLLAVQLANQQLAETQEKMQQEIDRLRVENEQLVTQNARLERVLAQADQHQKTLEQEYKRTSGERYQGKASTTKFGFSNTE
jgi:ABC-type transporter Mla subunit MlaD